MHNVNVESLLETVEQGTADPAALRQPTQSACFQALWTGATGLEPAISGVTV